MSNFYRIVLFLLGLSAVNAVDNQRWIELELFPVFVIGQERDIDSITLNDYVQHNKFMAIEFGFKLKGFEFFTAINLFQSPLGYADNTGLSNLPFFVSGTFDIADIFPDTPAEGFVEYRNDNFDISAGRRRWALGYGEYNMALSRQGLYNDGFWFSLHPETAQGGRWHYDFLLAGDEGKIVEKLIRENTLGDMSATRWFAVHKIGYEGKSWRIGLSENMMIAELDLGTMLFMPIWHNLSLQQLNDSFDLSFEKRFEHIRMYGDILMDDFTLPHEVNGGNPNAWGFYLGADVRLFDTPSFTGISYDNYESLKAEDNFAFTDGFVLSFQAALTTRYVYWRNTSHPLGTFTMHRRVPNGIIENYIGFPYGNDVLMAKASATWNSTKFLARGGLTLLLLGHDNMVRYYTDNDYTISNILPGDPVASTVQSDSNWFFSGIKTANLLFNPELYYALTHNISAYAGLNLRLVLNNIKYSNVVFNVGIYMNF
ncbi:hypothetical protein FACS1894172_12080 [Spirochaetia bacterium]|nr:hypothetical protein FACS1894164_01850 [Spirochaetia bacterium]GHU33477.1 hypothetical protein FACS1894172_12080 [Spirochaetia bacterium]